MRDAIMSGSERRVMKFTIATKYGYDVKEKKERVEFVPCTMFNASDELAKILTTEGKGASVEFGGRVSTSSYESNGEMKYKTEVVVNNRTLNLFRNR